LNQAQGEIVGGIRRAGRAHHPLRTLTRAAKFRFFIYKVHFTGHEADEALVDWGAHNSGSQPCERNRWGGDP
jgi:hypothetical protein